MTRRRTCVVLFAAFSALLALPVHAQNPTRTCTGCIVGVYDDVQMTRTTGSISAFQVKSIYLGIQLGSSPAISNLEFLAAYPLGFTVLDVTSYVPGAEYVQHGSGIRVTWPQCISGKRALFRVRILTFGAVSDAELRIFNAEVGSCTNPAGDRWPVAGGCYTINPRRMAGCGVAVEPSSWTTTKALFK